MRVLRVIICLLLTVAQLSVFVPQVHALSQSGVVISQMYPGSTSGAAQEFVELYNNGSLDVDVTGWCVTYISASGATLTKLGCLATPDAQTKLFVKASAYTTFVSNEYKAAFGSQSDVQFAGGISSSAGHIKLTNAVGTEIDRVGWGTATSPEGTVVAAPVNGKSLQRKMTGTSYQDTDNNQVDFSPVTPQLHSSSVYEVVTVIDLCPNVPDAQPSIPQGYGLDSSGNCQVDSCVNIDGLQTNVPDHYDSDAAGNCVQHDDCDNIAGIQTRIPDHMIRSGANNCTWDIAPLLITEILPNAAGSDAGNEFIEIFNPGDTMVDLSLYSAVVGTNGDKTYAFPVGATVAPGEYRTFSDSVMKFTLLNTSGRVLLRAIDGTTMGDTGIYNSPPDAQSWALINGVWEYTNQPTPGTQNVASVEDDRPIDVTDTGLASCPVGKYRNPLTNRCRTIVADAAILTSCDADQYRNPETGRCRKIDANSLAPCKDGQYRSETTNRCRNITTASTQKACKDNQYRSEETNRCRNLPASSVPDAAYAVQPVKDVGLAFAGWWALGGVGLAAAVYGVWEWRGEIGSFFGRLAGK